MSPHSLFLSLLTVTLATTGLLCSDPVTAATACRPGDQARVWTAPLRPAAGEPFEVLAVATDGALDQLLVTDPAGSQTTLRGVRYGGPPWGLHGGVFRPKTGTYRVEATRGGRGVACAEIKVGGGAAEQGTGDWDLATQALYAVWIERLFDGPPEQSLSFDSLAPVLRDPERNFLHGYLGTAEDNRLPAEPDCADLPYFLRAYFAWKLGLPIAYRPCNRGSRNGAPRCESPKIDSAFTGAPASAKAFGGVTRRIMDTVHSGSGRTGLRDESTDFYPVPLERSALWPGTVYADPYGHVMVLTKWIAQQPGQPGLLLAVDAQPDNSVARKRFWEGTFLFAQTPSAGPGFKQFRPLVRTGTAQGGARLLSNDALTGRDGLPPYSTEQAGLTPADFYARMERLINPDGLAPEAAYASTLAALMEQLQTRVDSVDKGEAYMRAHPGTVIPMPSGPAIFETTGPWEDFATPSRDMRLLIAMNVLAGLPERIRRYPDLYVLRGDSASGAAARIAQIHDRRLDEQFTNYTRGDGSPWRLSLRDIYARRAGLEVAYNPNDCIERRWGATPQTPDYATCRRQAPAEQRARMEEYRPWFQEARRPPR
ncbi:MAG: hypothetical protein JZU52_17140 [Lamprocystis purpurea]|uniref:hypothetical protein n=1 Tax=Lamprocystis purpurea TaxID=61598 RepID=UPI00037FF43C|nr:hypothetical protein [Lamprocystis purpurea]MBV5275289.1 hypothetical protein [Lamprocystis purpurea]